MPEAKCKGCQSFCMRGAQCGGQAPGTSTDKNYNSSNEKTQTYQTGWKHWKDIKKGDTIGGDKSIQNPFLSMANQNSLINYINAVYAEGNYNCNNGTLNKSLNDFKKGSLTVIQNAQTKSFDSTKTQQAKVSQSGEVITPKHYNNLLDVLTDLNSEWVVIKDPKGDNITLKNYQKEASPIAGKPSSQSVLKVVSDDLITADLYQDLYEKAAKLKYHPYQCNICNIYEGGEWLEIVKDLGEAINQANLPYSNSSTQNISAHGVDLQNMRQDCSGYVSGCLAIYDAIEKGATSASAGNQNSDAWRSNDGSGIPASVKQYFSPHPNGAPTKPGSIIVRYYNDEDHNAVDPRFGSHTSHVEIRGEHGIWSGGGGPNNMMNALDTGSTRGTDGWTYTGIPNGSSGSKATIPISEKINFLPLISDNSVTTEEQINYNELIPEERAELSLNLSFKFEGTGSVAYLNGQYITVWCEEFYENDEKIEFSLYNTMNNSFLDLSNIPYVETGEIEINWKNNAEGETYPSYILKDGAELGFLDFQITIGVKKDDNNKLYGYTRCDLTEDEIYDLLNPNKIKIAGSVYDKKYGVTLDLNTVKQVITYEWGSWSSAVSEIRNYASSGGTQQKVANKILNSGGIHTEYIGFLGGDVAVATDRDGNSFALCATTQQFGVDGDKLKIKFKDGNILYCVKVDTKSESHIYGPADPANSFGHYTGSSLSILELWYATGSARNNNTVSIAEIANLGEF